ncbi:iron ABC transporter permease [Streptococcus merionis]|uniref:FecCD family ABC transporter permease n=1 Tax=Streptococcus merionis TaxID=400065 RepID=UPI0026EDF995|nr:iron ABC transporter permease [Streptococcus merionis]
MCFQKRSLRTFVVLILILAACFCISLSVGESGAGFSDLIKVFSGQASRSTYLIMMRIRLPRLVACLVAGGSLALSGGLLQTLTRNPLADSGILGINAGAGMMVALVIAYFSLEKPWVMQVLPALAMLGGCVTILLVYFVARIPQKGISPVRLIIAGVGLSTMMSGVMVSIVGNVNRYKVDAIVNWLSGRISGDNWRTLVIISPLLLLLWGIAYSKSQDLNILNLQEQTAVALGLNVKSSRGFVLFLATALAALSVIIVGNITFVGLVSGHLARRYIGGDHRVFLPATCLLGMILLLVADSLGRVLLVGTGIPTGLIVSVLGAPYFLVLMGRLNAS